MHFVSRKLLKKAILQDLCPKDMDINVIKNIADAIITVVGPAAVPM